MALMGADFAEPEPPKQRTAREVLGEDAREELRESSSTA
jgi:hypothetical protein